MPKKDLNSNKSNLIRLFLFLKQDWLFFILTLIVYFNLIYLAVFQANANKGLIDSLTAGKMKLLKYYIILIIVAMIFELLTRMARTYTVERFSEYSVFHLRQKTVDVINHIKVSEMDRKSTGELISRVTNDIGVIQNFLKNCITQLIGAIIQIPILFVYLLFINWKLTVISVGCVPIFIFCSLKLSKRVEKKAKLKQEALAKVNSFTQDSVSGITVIKSFNLESIMRDNVNSSIDESVKKGISAAAAGAAVDPFWILARSGPYILLFLFGGLYVLNKEITLGTIMSYMVLLGYIVNPIYYFTRLLSIYRSSMASLTRIFEVWDLPNEDLNKIGIQAKSTDDVITFEDVNFKYQDHKDIFKDLSFTVKRGEKVALVGHSGCGKTTVLKLINHFYERDSGSIKVMGVDINEWNIKDLRNMISVVSQETYLFPESLYNNILYGNQKANKTDIENAAKAANVHEFIMSLPDGYQTVAGERGVNLSGGQKQRIAIARAILKDAPVLLLDEATSALDTEMEYDVQIALNRLMRNRTVLVIAHRLSTIKDVDRIIVLDDGKIAESGTHDELIHLDGLYKQLYLNQFSDKNSDSDIQEA